MFARRPAESPGADERTRMTAIAAGTDLSLIDGVAVITLDYPPVNALSPALSQGLYAAMMQALDDPAAQAIVLICAGSTFIAGADIKALGSGEPMADLFALQAAIEASPKPSVAAMHGTALGGGLETALTMHYRICSPGARLGLPEVKLGLLPGGGGTQRLPRVMGAEAALDLMLTGRQIGAREALAAGLVDRIATSEDSLRADALAFARELLAEGRGAQPIREREDRHRADQAEPDLFDRLRQTWAATLRGFDAPQAIVRCVEASVKGPWEAGLAVERAEFMQLLAGAQSAALRYVFLAERAAARIPGLPAELKPRTLGKVAVIGGGTMGSGITAAFIEAGYPVTMVEMNQEALDRGTTRVKEIFASRVERGKLTAEAAAERTARLGGALDYAAIADADLVVEAVFESMPVKRDIFAKLAAVLRPEAILATNTSFLDVNEIAAAATHPERVVGLHFFSPAHIMRLLEVVRGDKTSDEVMVTAMDLARKLGKVGVVSGVCFGFIGNRIWWARNVQAYELLKEGVSPYAMDAALVEFGYPMGHFQMLDLAGLDIGEPNALQSALIADGRRGQKSGAGFYEYSGGRRGAPDPRALELIGGVFGVTPGSKEMSSSELIERLTYPMINEGAKILAEGIALRASDIDVVYVMGYGWPPHRGGPMFYADQVGLPEVVAALKTMPEVTLAPLLERLAAEGGRLTG